MERSTTTHRYSRRSLGIGAVTYGVVVTGLLLVDFAVGWDGSIFPFGLLPFLVVGLAWGVNGIDLSRREQLVCWTLLPISAMLVLLTHVLGTSVFPGVGAWWIPGAVLSAVPLVVVGGLILRRPERGDGR